MHDDILKCPHSYIRHHRLKYFIWHYMLYIACFTLCPILQRTHDTLLWTRRMASFTGIKGYVEASCAPNSMELLWSASQSPVSIQLLFNHCVLLTKVKMAITPAAHLALQASGTVTYTLQASCTVTYTLQASCTVTYTLQASCTVTYI